MRGATDVKKEKKANQSIIEIFTGKGFKDLRRFENWYSDDVIQSLAFCGDRRLSIYRCVMGSFQQGEGGRPFFQQFKSLYWLKAFFKPDFASFLLAMSRAHLIPSTLYLA